MKNWKKYATDSRSNQAKLAAENYNQKSKGGQNIKEQRESDHAQTELWANTVSSLALLAVLLLLAFLYAMGNGQANSFSSFIQRFSAGLWLGAGKTLYLGSDPYSSLCLAVDIGFASLAAVNAGFAVKEVVKHWNDSSLKLTAYLNLAFAAMVLLLLALGFVVSL